MLPDPTVPPTSLIGQRFTRLTTAQQMIALREALAWQRQGMDWIAALTLAVEQVELASYVERLRRRVQHVYCAWQAAQRAKQTGISHYQEVQSV